MLEVLAPGVLSTIQDGGRPNAAHLGVPPCGACDSWSFAIANLLMGNPADAPVLEITLAGPELLVRETCTIALTGSDLGATSVGEGRPLTPGIAHTLWAGSTVRFERAASADGPDTAWLCDAPGRNRTSDTQIRSLLLYPLSYGRVSGRDAARVHCTPLGRAASAIRIARPRPSCGKAGDATGHTSRAAEGDRWDSNPRPPGPQPGATTS